MSEYIFTDALGYSMAQLAAMVNHTYGQSYLPLQQTALELARYCQYNSMDLGNSVVMFDADTFVGCSLLATRDRRGWVGSFGIVPEYRWRGAGAALLARQLAVSTHFGLTQLQLEAPMQTPQALRLCQSAGFTPRREFVDLLLTQALRQPANSPSITPAAPESLIDWLLQGQQPAWTRERINLLIKGGEAIVLTHSEARSALLYKRRDEKIQLYAAALSDQISAFDFAAMLHHAAAGATTISIHNEPIGTLLHQLCNDLGFAEEHRYHEMVVEL